jgi:hypothetical protein
MVNRYSYYTKGPIGKNSPYSSFCLANSVDDVLEIANWFYREEYGMVEMLVKWEITNTETSLIWVKECRIPKRTHREGSIF